MEETTEREWAPWGSEPFNVLRYVEKRGRYEVRLSDRYLMLKPPWYYAQGRQAWYTYRARAIVEQLENWAEYADPDTYAKLKMGERWGGR